MITSASLIAFIFALGLFIYWTLAFLVLYHLIRFGVSGQPKKIAAVFLAGSLVLTLVVILMVAQLDTGDLRNIGNSTLFTFD